MLTPDLSHYAPGATASIVQSTINPPTRTGSILPIIYAPNATGGGYSAAWDETVTDSNGVHNQVEFAMFKANSTGVTGSLIKQVTFQIADGLPQQVRVGTFTYLGQSYEVLAYGDTTSSHIIEFDSNGNQIASYSEATNQFFNQLEVFGDGRVGLSYDNVIDSAGDTELTTNIIDLRTSGIPVRLYRHRQRHEPRLRRHPVQRHRRRRKQRQQHLLFRRPQYDRAGTHRTVSPAP